MKGSGVVAVVVAAFYLTYRGPDTIKPQNRFYGLPIWSFVSYVMNGALFVLVGVQLPSATALWMMFFVNTTMRGL